jgi:hypothetical protein
MMSIKLCSQSGMTSSSYVLPLNSLISIRIPRNGKQSIKTNIAKQKYNETNISSEFANTIRNISISAMTSNVLINISLSVSKNPPIEIQCIVML